MKNTMKNITLLYIYSTTYISNYVTNEQDITAITKKDMDTILQKNEGELISIDGLIYLFNSQYISDEGYLVKYID